MFRNPVHPLPFADPFVLRHEGVYYAYGTPPEAGAGVPVLQSRDLVHWSAEGACLPDTRHVWAPEVAYHRGKFYMYFSAGGPEGEGHQVQVAVADSPLGPFRPLHVLVPDEPFSIDASPFMDEDGHWWLYYCKDFLEGERPGTGIVVDRLVEMTRLEGNPRVVLRASHERQLFERQRNWYGRTWDWYTVEGPFCVRRGDRLYLLYSGGCWKEPGYGLSWMEGTAPDGPFREGGDLLQTVPGRIVGPGHACVVRGPDLVTDWLVYHAWDAEATGRTMRLEPLEWTPEGPSCAGARLEDQPGPVLAESPEPRPVTGWWARRGEDGCEATGTALAWLAEGDVVVEGWVLSSEGPAGFVLGDDEGFEPLMVRPAAWPQHLRVEMVDGQVRAWVNGVKRTGLPPSSRVGLMAVASARFRGLGVSASERRAGTPT